MVQVGQSRRLEKELMHADSGSVSNAFLKVFITFYSLVCVCARTCMHNLVTVRGQPVGVSLRDIYHTGPRDQTQAIRFGGKFLYLPSYPAGPVLFELVGHLFLRWACCHITDGKAEAQRLMGACGG